MTMQRLRSRAAQLVTSLNSAIIAAILVATIGAWHITQSREVLVSNAESDALNLARSLSQHAARTFEGADLVLSDLDERLEGNPDREQLRSFLQRRASHAVQISNLVVTNAKGDWIADTVPTHAPINSADRAYFVWHRDHPNRDLYLGDPVQGRYSGRTIMPLARRIDNADGSFGGIAVAALEPEYLQTFYETVHIGAHGSVSLYNTDGHVIARFPAAPENANFDAARMAQSAKDFAKPASILRLRARIDGVERIFAFEHVPGYPLVVSAGIAVDDILARWRRESAIEAVAILIASVGLLALGFGSERSRQRILSITKAAEQIHAQYRLLAEHSSDVVALKPTFAGPRTYVSPSCRTILGWEPEVFGDLSAQESIHPDDVERVEACFAALSPRNPRAVSEHRLRHKAGHYVWVETIFELTGDLAPNMGVIATARDITLRKRDEAARQESENRYRLLAENSADLIWLRPSFAGMPAYVSPSCRTTVGWDPDELEAIRLEDWLHPEDFDRVASQYTSPNVAVTPLHIPHRVRHKAGHYIWIEAVFRLTAIGTPQQAVVVAARDVSSRKLAEDALRDSESRYRLLAENSHTLITVKSSFTAHRSYVSPSSRLIVGWEPWELAELPVADFVHPDDLPGAVEAFTGLSAESPTHGSTCRIRHKDGRWLWADCFWQLVNAGTPAETVVLTARDVTERVEAVERLVESEANYRLLAQASSDIVSRIDLEGRQTFSSPASFEILGYHPEELLRQPLLDFVRPEFAEEMNSLMRDLAHGRRDHARLVFRTTHKHGHDLWLDARFRLVRDPGTGSPSEIVSNMRDVSDRENLQRLAQEANRRLALAEETANVGHWHVDLRSNQLTWSEGVYRIHGLDRSTFALNVDSAIERYHPDDRAEVERLVTAAITRHQPLSFKLRIVRPDSTIRYVATRGLCETNSAGEVIAIFGAIMDVTDLANAERAHRRQSGLLETTLNNMDQGLIKVAKDGTVVLANKRLLELLDLPGHIFDQPKPKFATITAFLSLDGKAFPAELMSRHESGTEARPAAVTGEMHLPDGTILEVRTVKVPSGACVSTFADVTARRHAERALRDSETRYRMLADTTSDVITQLDLHLVHQYVSPACRAVLGYEPEDMLGIAAPVFIHPEAAATVWAALAALRAGRMPGDKTTLTNRMRHKDGRWIWLEAGLNLIRDPDTGAPASLVCSLRDVTDRQRSARQLERARAAAEQASLAKAAFMANMSHELRTPLTGILGIHDLLERDTALGNAQKRLVGLASASSRSLLNIVNDILDFSKIEAGQLTIEALPFDLRTLVETCQALGREGVGDKPVRVTSCFDPDEPGWFIGDPNRLQQILLNLITNAVKFTERGTVAVDVEFRPATGKVRIAVTDTGVGIAGDKLSLLFQRFSQADASTARRYGGTGLGLAISKHLIELMGGQIGVRSEPGQGSCFWFELALARCAEAGEQSHSARPLDVQCPSYKILLAEDNMINREIIEAMLKTYGHEATLVDDGAAAIAAIEAGGTFDLALMDVQMPGVDGLTATSVIRERERRQGCSRLPIIGLTANAMPEDIQRCLAAGMDGHVAKPIDWQTLTTTMERVVGLSLSSSSDVLHNARRSDSVVDRSILESLRQAIGLERLARMLSAFAEDVERRLESSRTYRCQICRPRRIRCCPAPDNSGSSNSQTSALRFKMRPDMVPASNGFQS